MSKVMNWETNPTLLIRLRRTPTDHNAWKQFTDRYGEQIFTWCRRWGLQHADSQDVTQTIMLKLVRALQTFEYNQSLSFRSWLKTLTHHAWHDLVNSRRVVGTEDSLSTVLAHDDLVQQIDAAYERELVECAMNRIRLRVQPQTWEAFQRTAIDNKPAAEVANELNMPVMSVYKAKSNIQKMLEAEIRKLSESESA